MDKRDRAGRTDLHYAALEDDSARAQALIAAGADLNVQDRGGFTPLHFAAQQYSVTVARLLLESGAKVDSVNRYGNTPLWTAVFDSKGRGGVIELLRGAGADPKHFNRAGQTPVGLARLIGNLDVAQFFVDVIDLA
jgi:ankyrin repeat protein